MRVLGIFCVWTLALGCNATVPGNDDDSPTGGVGGNVVKTGSGGRGITGDSDGSVSRPVGVGGSRFDVDAAVGPSNSLDAPTIATETICGPSAGDPYWVEEGATVTAKLKCATGSAATGDAFTLGVLPRGATYDPVTATLTWNTALDSAGVYLIPITVKPWNETGQLKIGVADKFDDVANVPVKDPATYTEEFGLPVFHLTIGPDLAKSLPIAQARQDAVWINACKPLCGPSLYTPISVVYRGKTYMAEGHYRGASSLQYPKRNYTLRFNKDDKFSEPFAGGGKMTKRRHIALITTFDDNSYLRWRLAFDLWNRLDPKIIRIEHFSAVVYVNGKYVGLYAVSDKIDDDMMQRAGLAEDGNLYMAINHNGTFDTMARQEGGPMTNMVRPRNCPFEGFTKKEGLPEECDVNNTFVPTAYNDLVSLVDFVSKSDDAKFQAGLGPIIDPNDYTAWWIHATAAAAADSYAKNGLHYHDAKINGPWRAVVWDYNASFGQTWNTVRTAANSPDPNRYAVLPAAPAPAANKIWQRMLADAIQGPKMKARYAAVLKDEMKIETVLATFDGFVEEIDPSARRDERRWTKEFRTYFGPASPHKRMEFTTFSEEIVYTRSWLQMRWQYLKTLFP